MTPTLPLFVCAEAVDFRLGIDGLALRVQASLGPQRALNAAHVFFNRGRDKVKVLWYDRHGWWLMYKRLEHGRFAAIPSGALSDVELRLVLEGVDLSVRRFAPVRGVRVA